MKILAMYAEDYPWDVRVEKLLTGFQAHGCITHLVCRNLARRAPFENVGGIACRRVLGPGPGAFAHRLLTVPFPANPLWQRALRQAIAAVAPDLVLVRDLPLAPLALREARRVGLPVIVDMAENHPAMWKNVLAADPLPMRSWLLKNPHLARLIERRVAQRADAIFVVVEEMRRHLLSLGASPAHVHIVSNTPPLRILDEAAADPRAGGSTLEIAYAGFITPNRGLQVVLGAMALLGHDALKCHFHVVGRGEHLERLVAMTQELALVDKVTYHGWVSNDQIPGLLRRCNVGVIPHLKTEHTDTTVPNKLFDFMAMGLPVVVADAEPLRRLVAEEQCGLCFRSGSPTHLAARLRELVDPTLRSQLGERGRSAVRERFHWEADFARAMDVATALVARPTDGPQEVHSPVS